MSTLNDRDRENLTAYLDGELDGKTAQALEAKINLDPEARQEVEALKKAWGLLDYLPKPELSANFTSRTLDRVSAIRPISRASQINYHHGKRLRPWVLRIGWAAAVLVAALVGYGGGHWLSNRSRQPASALCPPTGAGAADAHRVSGDDGAGADGLPDHRRRA